MPRRLDRKDMVLTQTSQDTWMAWLTEERHISLSVIRDAGLIGAKELAIPIYNEAGDVLFYKYRRAPGNEDGPKYRYEAGSTASLYGIEKLQELVFGEILIIAEGELDVLALRTLGYKAVSSTGGSGTWKKEWSDKIRQHTNAIVVAYDADRAGIYGAMKVASLTPGCRIAWLPVGYARNYIDVTKDHTDIIHAGKEESLHECFHQARHYGLPLLEDENRLGRLCEVRKVMQLEQQDMLRSPIHTTLHIDLALEWVQAEIEKEDVPSPSPRTDASDDKLERAKAHPITALIKVSRDGFAKCVYHEEKSASMKVYKENRAHSFCCGKSSDALDIYQAVHSCDFKTALDALQS